MFTASSYLYHTPNFLDLHSEWAEPWELEKMAAYESIVWMKTNTTQTDVILSNDFAGIREGIARDYDGDFVYNLLQGRNISLTGSRI